MKKLLSIALVIAMMASMLALGVSAAADTWDGTADTSWFDPTKTEFTITTAKQLAGMAELSKQGITFAGVTVKLGADIALNTGDYSTWAEVAPANVWNPIGTKDAPFQGTFDGQGHTISGIYTPNPGDSKDASVSYKALFGYAGDAGDASVATFTNLYITNSNVQARLYAAGCVASAVGTIKVSNVHVSKTSLSAWGDKNTDKATSNVDTGAIVGFLNSITEATIENCSFVDGYAEGYVRVGSIVGGGNGIYLNVKNCYSNSYIKADNRPGGIVGHSGVSLVEIENCYFEGTVDATATANYGGIFGGYRPGSGDIMVKDCYYAGSYLVKGAASTARVGCSENGLMTDDSVYYTAYADDSSMTPSGNDPDGAEVDAKVKGDGAKAAFVATLDTAIWDTATLKLKGMAASTPTTPPTADTTKAPTADTTKAPTEDTTKAPTQDTTGTVEPAPTGDMGMFVWVALATVAMVAIVGTALVERKRTAK